MTIENLKSKLHTIFEHCGHCGITEEINLVKEEVPVPAIPEQPTNGEQDFKSQSGIVYKISSSNGAILVKDATNKVIDTFTPEESKMDGTLKKNERTKIATQLGVASEPQQTQPQAPIATQPATTPTQPTKATDPVEAPVAENVEVINKFKDEYGEKGKNIYYATANKQDRNPETFEKK